MHDQKFGTFYSLRPEDGLYGSNEPKKCEIRPVVSSIVHFKVFKSYFIYIIDFFTLFCQKRTFCHATTFFESLITHKRSIVEESYVSHGKRQKSCTLIVI